MASSSRGNVTRPHRPLSRLQITTDLWHERLNSSTSIVLTAAACNLVFDEQEKDEQHKFKTTYSRKKAELERIRRTIGCESLEEREKHRANVRRYPRVTPFSLHERGYKTHAGKSMLAIAESRDFEAGHKEQSDSENDYHSVAETQPARSEHATLMEFLTVHFSKRARDPRPSGGERPMSIVSVGLGFSLTSSLLVSEPSAGLMRALRLTRSASRRYLQRVYRVVTRKNRDFVFS